MMYDVQPDFPSTRSHDDSAFSQVRGSDVVCYHEGLGHALNMPHPSDGNPDSRICAMGHGMYQNLPLERLVVCNEIKADMGAGDAAAASGAPAAAPEIAYGGPGATPVQTAAAAIALTMVKRNRSLGAAGDLAVAWLYTDAGDDVTVLRRAEPLPCPSTARHTCLRGGFLPDAPRCVHCNGSIVVPHQAAEGGSKRPEPAAASEVMRELPVPAAADADAGIAGSAASQSLPGTTLAVKAVRAGDDVLTIVNDGSVATPAAGRSGGNALASSVAIPTVEAVATAAAAPAPAGGAGAAPAATSLAPLDIAERSSDERSSAAAAAVEQAAAPPPEAEPHGNFSPPKLLFVLRARWEETGVVSPAAKARPAAAGAAGASLVLSDMFHFEEVVWVTEGGAGPGVFQNALEAGMCAHCASQACNAAGQPLILLDQPRNIAIAIVGRHAFLSSAGVHGKYYPFHTGQWLGVSART